MGEKGVELWQNSDPQMGVGFWVSHKNISLYSGDNYEEALGEYKKAVMDNFSN